MTTWSPEVSPAKRATNWSTCTRGEPAGNVADQLLTVVVMEAANHNQQLEATTQED